MRDLFGNEVPEQDFARTPAQKRRSSERPNGYYAAPGTGPKGETCGTCMYRCRLHAGSKGFYKCGLAKRIWSHSRRTDILLKTPACIGWQAEDDG